MLALTQGPDDSHLTLHHLDAASGERLGHPSVPLDAGLDLHGPSGLLLKAEDRLVSASDARTGDLRWTEDGDTFTAAGDLVLLDGGRALFGETGEQVWERPDLFPTGGPGLAVGEDILVYESGDNGPDLVFRHADTGEAVWRGPFLRDEPEFGAPLPPLESLVADTTVLLPPLAGERERPTAVDALTGEPRWTYEGAYGEDGRVASVPGAFVLSTGEATVCLAAADGAERWRDDAGDTGAVRTTDAFAVLYRTKDERVFRRWTTVRILDAEDGRERWTGQFDSTDVSAPATGDGLTVVLDQGGTVWALRV
ncbi:hypothetical protein DEH69_00065 [Streptomyces sp. PT12]|nr:hypothetical protein DEH69_00065 [Streptomyces sp. PT12]